MEGSQTEKTFPKMVRDIVLGVLAGVVIDATIQALHLEALFPALPYIWFAIVLYLTLDFLKRSKKTRDKLVVLYARLNKGQRVLSYIIVGLIGIAVAEGYWIGIKKIFEIRAEKPAPTMPVAATKPSEPTQPREEQKKEPPKIEPPVIQPKKRVKIVPPEPLPKTEKPAKKIVVPPNAPKSFAEFEEAKRRLETNPDQLTLHDLFSTDFSSSETTYPQTWHLEAPSKPKIDIESIVAWRLAEGTELIAFYIPYSKETHDICISWIAPNFREIMQDKHKFGVEQKIPGQSPQLSASNLVFSNRIYVYHEAYLTSAEQSDLENGFKGLGIQIILRGSDFLANKKLEAKVKLLENKH